MRPDATCRKELLSKKLIDVLSAPWLLIHESKVSAAQEDTARAAAISILDSVLELDSDRGCGRDATETRARISPMMTVSRDNSSVRVYKRTYLSERQQMAAGKKLPTSRLAKIAAAAQQMKQENERTAKRDVEPAGEEPDVPTTPQMVKLGAVIAIATCTAGGAYEWWAGRVEKMRRKSSRSDRYLDTTDSLPFDEAKATKMKVICTWYRKHTRYSFTYDGPIDDVE